MKDTNSNMAQYVLVEKDANLMQKCWRWLIVLILALIIITCFISSNGYSALLSHFKYNCISSAAIVFKRIHNDPNQSPDTKGGNNTDNRPTSALSMKFQSYYESKYEPKQSEPHTTKAPSLMPPVNPSVNMSTNHSKDIEFFNNYEIDEISTRWGSDDSCSFYYYFPVVEITAAAFWIVMMVISGRTNALIHKSWRLVIPSVICFSAIALLCAIYATYLNNRLNGFCSELRTHFTNNELPCTLLIDRFRLGNATRLVTASTSFHLVKSVSYARVFLWLLAGFVMLLRCILAADFRITEVERGEQRGRSVNVTDTDNTDNASSVKFINDADVRYYPQGNVYNATTQKLQIDD